jgi:hypothetical protein
MIALSYRGAGFSSAAVILGALAAAAPVPALAADSPYAVAKVMVDTSAKDAVAAKEAALADAEARAVDTVLRRLVRFASYPQLPNLAQDDVEGLVYNVSFRREQNSTTRYLATLDVNLNEEAVKQLLANFSLPYSEARAPRIKILPVVFEGDAIKRDGAGGWRQAWADLDLANAMAPADLVDLRPTLDAPTVKAILAGNAAAYAKLQSAYGDEPLVLAVGEGLEGGKLAMRLVGADGVGEINFGRVFSVQDGDYKTAARDAAALGQGVLENRWKVMQSAPGGGPRQASREEGQAASQGEPERNVVAVVEFSGLKEWQEIRARLMQVSGIQGLEVNALSARTASITFDYAGSLGRLQKELDQDGFVFENRADAFVIHTR